MVRTSTLSSSSSPGCFIWSHWSHRAHCSCHAAQSLDTSKRKAVAEIVVQALEQSLASDPEGFEDMCRLYVTSPKTVLNLFMGERDIKDAIGLLGATKKDFRSATNIALKKACYGYKP